MAFGARILKRQCCKCQECYEIPYLGYRIPQRNEYYQQGVYFFVPFYKWSICRQCIERHEQESPFAWKVSSFVRLFASLALNLLFFLGLFVLAFYVGGHLLWGEDIGLIAVVTTLIIVGPLLFSIHCFFVR